MRKNERPLRCHRCQRTFPRPHTTGRIPRYCSGSCRSASYRRRTSTPSRPRSYNTASVRLSRAVLRKAQAMAHRAQRPVPALPLEVLQICVTLRRDLDDLTAVAVRQALADGALWKDIAKVMGAAESTLKNNYSLDKVDKMLKARMQRGPARSRQAAAPKDPDSTAGSRSHVHRLLPGQAGYPLSCALSHLRRTSENTVGSLAYLTGVSASYIYRITSGERTPTWDVTRRFALVCEAEPEDLMFLWNAAHSLQTPPARSYTEALRTLQSALRGLHLAASSPDLTRLRKSTHLTARAAQTLLSAADAPVAACYLRWPVVRDLTTALQGDPQAIRPLWECLKSLSAPDDGGPSWPAAAFG
ncbi:helix-turn-helix transcriptional regulator [Streptomyces sp. N2A]|uniref:helix-turn-helix domain-containing protein n=1 Tax=Streptomyces sp. N2A TaxID=3073936 RepID=UPI00286FF4E9|nr:helix-turn-helix transcriptional regulator [Streptomyces sp. N2A]